MAAGQGFKTFTTGEVLTAGDVNGYLMQGVLVFASAAARDAAITSPQEGQFAFTKDTNGLWYYDGAAWVASGATGDIEGVTAGVGISGGGTSGTVTITNSMATAIDAKGDLVPGTGADTFSRLAVGANDTVLTADSTAATGMKWAAVSGGAGNLAEIASGTLSGATGATLTGLTSYSELIFKVNGVTWGTNFSQFLVRLNSNSTSNYAYYGWGFNGSPTYYPASFNNGDTCFRFNKNNNQLNTDASNNYFIKLTNCKTTGFTDVSILSSYENSNGQTTLETYNGVFKVSAAISSIDLLISAGYSFTAGAYVLWGA
jgi:hypothetical protein